MSDQDKAKACAIEYITLHELVAGPCADWQPEDTYPIMQRLARELPGVDTRKATGEALRHHKSPLGFTKRFTRRNRRNTNE